MQIEALGSILDDYGLEKAIEWYVDLANKDKVLTIPAVASAASTALLIESTARSRLTMTPLRQPFDSAAPRPATSSFPFSSGREIRAPGPLMA